MSTENDNPQEPKRTHLVAMPRLGNVQALIEMHGEGVFRQPYVRFDKLMPKGSPPELKQLWSVEEVAALRQLCDNILRDLYVGQTLVFPNGEQITPPPPGQAIEKETP